MNTSISKEIGLRLREERERNRFSQSGIAKMLAIGRSTQIRYEDGTRSPSAEYLARVAAIGIDVVYVLTGKRHTIKKSMRPQDALETFDFTHPAGSNAMPKQDFQSLRKTCNNKLGIDFLLKGPCPNLGEKCTKCTENDRWCRWKLLINHEDLEIDMPSVPKGHFPWSDMSHQDMYLQVMHDPTATNRELALADMVFEYGIRIENDLQRRVARILCPLFHKAGAFKKTRGAASRPMNC